MHRALLFLIASTVVALGQLTPRPGGGGSTNTYTFVSPLSNNGGSVSIPGVSSFASTATNAASATGLNGTAIPSASSTALGNTPNGPGAFVSANANGSAAPNIQASKGAYITTGFFGSFLSGNERVYMDQSPDLVNYSQLPGVENYSPPPDVTVTTGNTATNTTLSSVANTSMISIGTAVTGAGIPSNDKVTAISGSTVTIGLASTATATGVTLTFTRPTGLRDPHVTKIGADIYMACTVSYNGGTENYCDISHSSDTTTFTHVGSPNAGGPNTSPKWYFDSAKNPYLASYTQITPITALSPTGVTVGTPVTFTFTDGSTMGFGDQYVIDQGSTHILFYNRPGSPQTYRIATSSTSISSGYTDQGAPANWHTAVEGVRVYFNSITGVYTAGFSDGSMSSTTTPQIASSWGTSFNVNISTLTGLGNPLAGSGDNGAGFFYTDADTLSEVITANLSNNQSVSSSANNAPVAGGMTRSFRSINLNGASNVLPGSGTISCGSGAGVTMTGIGTFFKQQLSPGACVNGLTSGGGAYVQSVQSETSATVISFSSFTAGESFTYQPPAFSVGSNFGLQPEYYITGDGGNFIEDFSRGSPCHWFYAGGTLYRINVTSTDWQLGNRFGSTTPFDLKSNASSGDITLTSAGVILGNAGNVIAATMTANSTSTITFNTTTFNETIYNTSATTLGTGTITLPVNSIQGQVLQYVTAGAITTATISGTVDAGLPAVTTLSANSSITYKAESTSTGSARWVRVQ